MLTVERYDIIGDLHGCVPALRRLCDRLGYSRQYRHAGGRKLVFIGDLADRGPDNPGALRLVMELVETGRAWSVLGNHDQSLLRKLLGTPYETGAGLEQTGREIDALPEAETFKAQLSRFLSNTPLLLQLDGGKLIVAHAGVEAEMLERPIDDGARHFILNGDEIGKSPDGKTLRRDWAAEYHGDAFIVYGHTPQDEPLVRSNSANIDTGAYRHRALTALRWPEREVVSVAAGW